MRRVTLWTCVVTLILSACAPGGEGAGSSTESAASSDRLSLSPHERFADDQFVPSFSAVHFLRTYQFAESSGEETETDGAEPSDELAFVRTPRSLLTLGEEIEIGSTVTGTFQDGSQQELTHVRNAEGETFWMSARYAVPGGELTVVVAEEAVLYDRPSVLNPTDRVVPRGTIFVFDPDESTEEFVTAAGWNDATGTGFNGVFIRTTDISIREDDIQVALLLKLASFSDSDVRRRAFLTEAADQSYATSEFYLEATETWEELTAEDSSDGQETDVDGTSGEESGEPAGDDAAAASSDESAD